MYVEVAIFLRLTSKYFSSRRCSILDKSDPSPSAPRLQTINLISLNGKWPKIDGYANSFTRITYLLANRIWNSIFWREEWFLRQIMTWGKRVTQKQDLRMWCLEIWGRVCPQDGADLIDKIKITNYFLQHLRCEIRTAVSGSNEPYKFLTD